MLRRVLTHNRYLINICRLKGLKCAFKYPSVPAYILMPRETLAVWTATPTQEYIAQFCSRAIFCFKIKCKLLDWPLVYPNKHVYFHQNFHKGVVLNTTIDLKFRWSHPIAHPKDLRHFLFLLCSFHLTRSFPCHWKACWLTRKRSWWERHNLYNLCAHN